MKKLACIAIAFAALLAALGNGSTVLAGGSGTLKLGWVGLDEEGNQSVAYRAFNEYEGPALSLEDVRYTFSTGQQLRANLKNITLNNRDLNLSIVRPGRYGVSLYNSQYRRVYSFDGGSFTRRNRTGGTVNVYPHKNVKLYAGGDYTARSGESVDLFAIGNSPNVNSNPRVEHDYTMTSYRAGFDLVENLGALRGEYRATEYKDDKRPTRDQNRQYFTVSAAFPVPRAEFITLHGGYRRFQTKYELDEFEMWSNFGWGGAAVILPRGFNIRYNLYFDRSGSDSDFVETDHLANAVFVGYDKAKIGGASVGYQHEINDDFEDEVQSNTIIFSGWLQPVAHLKLRGQYGNRAEEVKDGARFVGDEDRSRYAVEARYRVPSMGNIMVKYENRHRENQQLGTEVDFDRFLADLHVFDGRYGSLSTGYAYSTGDYTNIDEEDNFAFKDHLLYGELTTREWHNATGGFGATYYRSKRDLDVESFSLRFSGGYRFGGAYKLEIEYNVHNFDDFLVTDRYYTANIVSVSLSREFGM